MPFAVPVIAAIAWWYVGTTAVEAYHLATKGVVTSGQVIAAHDRNNNKAIGVRFVTADGQQVESTAVPRCEVKKPGDPVEVRYVRDNPDLVQDACDPPVFQVSLFALLVAVATTVPIVLVPRAWWQIRKSARAHRLRR